MSTARARTWASTPVNLTVFVVAFLFVAAIVRANLRPPAASGLRNKFEYFAEHKDEYDVVFVGSSHVLCSVIPEVFEQELSQRGVEVRAFNFGVPGMLSFETDEYVRRILELEPARLKWLVCELSTWRLDKRYLIVTDRTVAWRTPERTMAVLEVEWLRDLPLSTRLSDTIGHLELLGRYVGNVGELQKRLAADLGVRDVDPGMSREEVDDGQGYQALEVSGDEGAAKARAEFLLSIPAYRKRVDNLLARRAAVDGVSPLQRPPLARRLALFDEHGVDVVHVVFATDKPEAQPLLMARENELRLWSFCDPDRYAELYEVENRFDARHLARSGAEAFTRLLAERFAELF